MKNKKMILGLFALGNLSFLNFARSEALLPNLELNTSSSSSTTATSSSSSSTSAGGAVMKWTGSIDCPVDGEGSYMACCDNGSGNTCSTPGETTCTCGVNCKN